MEETTFKQYTPEQEEKIAMLRKEAEAERWRKSLHKNEPRRYYPSLQKGSDCTVTIGGMTIIGTVVDMRQTKSGTKVYDISTPAGMIKDFTSSYLEKRRIRLRIKKDLSRVVVPETLKKMSTPNLIRLLRSMSLDFYYDYEHYNRYAYTEDQVRAELATRPHIPNKRETQIIRQWQKIH